MDGSWLRAVLVEMVVERNGAQIASKALAIESEMQELESPPFAQPSSIARCGFKIPSCASNCLDVNRLFTHDAQAINQCGVRPRSRR